MQAIILAAGTGRRLGGTVPKPLLKINGKPILVRLIEQLKRRGVDDVVVVTGYQKHMLEGAIAHLNVNTVFNPFYPISDNLASFWIGQRHIHDSCILAHGDIILEDELLPKLIETGGDVVLPMDTSSLDQESMKMRVVDGELVNLSKAIALSEATGESLPLMKFSREAIHELKELTDAMLASKEFRHFIDDAILKLIRENKFMARILDVTGYKWVEIDVRSDLERARQLFSA